MKLDKFLLIQILLFFIFPGTALFAQLSPPGMGKTNTASWFAAGVSQKLDSVGKHKSVTYLGIGRISTLSNNNPFNKPAIIVINQEFYNQIRKHWQYSFAFSYRRQNEYEDKFPYNPDSPEIRQEFRLYGRYSYLYKISKLSLSLTYRQEFRKFYTTNFDNWKEPFELRSRVKAKLALSIDNENKHRFIITAEALLSISKKESYGWSNFGYHESRFCFYYSYSPRGSNLTFDIGYMNDLLGYPISNDAHYVAFDIIIKNPFKVMKKTP